MFKNNFFKASEASRPPEVSLWEEEKNCEKMCEFAHCVLIQFTLKVVFSARISALRASILILNETFLIDSVALQTSLIRTQEESWQALDAQKLPILTYLDNHHLNFCFSHSRRRQNAVFCWKLLALFWRHYQAAEPVFFGTRDFKLQKWLSYEKMQRNYLEKIESPLGGVIYTYILQHCELN